MTIVSGVENDLARRFYAEQVDLLLGGTDVLLGAFKDKPLLQPIRPLLILPEMLDPSAWFKGKLRDRRSDSRVHSEPES